MNTSIFVTPGSNSFVWLSRLVCLYDIPMVGNIIKNEVQVRSSSRLGYLDFGVNAKRLNYIAKKMKEKGWDARGVELKTHLGYAEENNLKEL